MNKTAAYVKEYLDKAVKAGTGLTKALIHLTDIKIAHRTAVASRTQITVTNSQCIKCSEDYDFTFQPNVNKAQLYDLATLRFIENQENILFYGMPGVGKTHLATPK